MRVLSKWQVAIPHFEEVGGWTCFCRVWTWLYVSINWLGQLSSRTLQFNCTYGVYLFAGRKAVWGKTNKGVSWSNLASDWEKRCRSKVSKWTCLSNFKLEEKELGQAWSWTQHWVWKGKTWRRWGAQQIVQTNLQKCRWKHEKSNDEVFLDLWRNCSFNKLGRSSWEGLWRIR